MNMRVSIKTNKLIDWKTEKGYPERKAMFLAYRRLFRELDKIPAVKQVFKGWNVSFLDIDDFPRINVDVPTIRNGKRVVKYNLLNYLTRQPRRDIIMKMGNFKSIQRRLKIQKKDGN